MKSTLQQILKILDHYKKSEADIYEPYLSPCLASDHSNLPPALIITAEYDPLIDEGRAYAEYMKAAGNEVQYSEYKGMIHSFFVMPRINKASLEAHDEVRRTLKKAFEKAERQTLV